ncbi:Protein transport protein SEC31 [Hypsizygus marmoreus]|uniref:Protein transport protein SEC31 n=1 Tax=Hypsizygus marmoreus TaxID=39966 RepID=A0A369JE01_HYPMA|nr:Protein transport protein SEC31 [Hypsizygus marmoreus]
MKLKEIHRTSTFAWSPTASLPLLATGTVAGALDESFSNESQLEIWAPNFLDRDEYDLGGVGQNGPKGIVKDTSRFNRLAWGVPYDSRSSGIIAAGMENGELALWDPAKILAGAGASESLILRNTTHTGPVRGLDFNPIQTSLLASGGVAGEVYIWDLKDPSKPYTPTPGARSSKLDEITSVAWNQQVQYVLAGASSTGYTVVWDLRGKREVVALAYGGGAGTLAGQAGTGSGLAVGGRRGMSDIAWHPDNATRLVTASEDDSSPIIMVWDLRNARAPEKILTGHEKGVLSLSWCKQDADLLLSCGKDNRALCWNPQTSEIIGELPSAENWAFQVDWCPRNPDLLATAFFDGTVGIHSIQSTNEAPTPGPSTAQVDDGADIFGFSRSSAGGTLSLKQPPKWLRRPTSCSFGFGGKLVTVSNLPSTQGKNQSSVVHIRKVVTEPELVDRATKLQAALEGGADALKTFAEERSGEDAPTTKAGWKALLSLFKANSRDELVALLGFSKSEIAARVAEAVENLKAASAENESVADDTTEGELRGPVVSFAEPERLDSSSEGSDAERDEKTPSEVSASVTSDTTSAHRLADIESTTTVPSLFGDDDPGTPQDAGVDFFSTIAQGNVLVPHTNYGLDSSVAATIGSGPSSVSSESLKSNSFRIYPADEADTDRLVTKALVLGDFESAVSLCLSSERFADAILLAVRGGPDLLQRTQNAYFERRTTSLPYLRLFQSIVTNDLSDIVQNADLQEWQEIFVVLCTFATQDEFAGLAEQLGRRLEFQFTVAASSEDPHIKEDARDYRQNATLTYLAAARLERLVNIWIDELAEEEKKLVSGPGVTGSRFSAHTHALQSFVEKVTVFRAATKYKDPDLAPDLGPNADVREFKLASLYDRYLEYADLLTTQGLIKEAVAFLNLTPAEYKGSNGIDFSAERARLLVATGKTPTPSAPAVAPAAPASRAPVSTYTGYSGYAPTTQPVAPAQPVSVSQPAYQSYNATGASAVTSNAYAPVQPNLGQTPYQSVPSYTNPNVAYQQSLTQPPHLRPQAQPQPAAMVPPPPRASTSTPGDSVAPPPPTKYQENGGWNDAPVVNPTSRAPSTVNAHKPAAITTPFPNQVASPAFSPGAPYTSPGQVTSFPPPRPGSVQAHIPPPPQGHRMAGPPPPGRPVSRTAGAVPPPARMISPQGHLPPRQPTPGQYAAPPQRGPAPGQTPPPPGPGPYSRPPPGQHIGQPPAHGGFAPPPLQGGPYGQGGPISAQPPQQQQPSPYAPPPGAQLTGPPSHLPPQPRAAGPQGSAQIGGPPPPPPGGPAAGPPRVSSRTTARQTGPPPPKYPPGDRSHIPEFARPAFNVISEQLNRMRQMTPPQQKRLVDDLERRINPLFDALNCETLSKPVVDQLLVLTRAMENHDRPAALAIHVDLLTRGSQTDDIGLWMSGVKQLILRL